VNISGNRKQLQIRQWVYGLRLRY